MTGHRSHRVDAFLARMETSQTEAEWLREVLLGLGLDETLKWRQPAYQFEGQTVLLLSQDKSSLLLAFMRGALLDDPEGRLEVPGPNSQAARQMRFQDGDDPRAEEDAIRAFVTAAIEVHRSGRRVAFTAKDDLTRPVELVEALEGDADFASAFDALTPGRQRSWIMHYSSAKKPETRTARVLRSRDKVFSGKGQSEY